MMSGLIPAIPLIIIRPFLPESPTWQQKRDAGTLKRPSFAELFSPELRRTTLVTTLMFAMSYGAAFGAIQHIPRIVPVCQSKAQVQLPLPPQRRISRTRKGKSRAASRREQHRRRRERHEGAGNWRPRRSLSSRRACHHHHQPALAAASFQIPGLILMPIVFGLLRGHESALLYVGIFLAAVTIAQFSFWGNYLPRLSGASAGHRGKLRREHRRPADRHLVRMGHRDTGDHTRPGVRTEEARVRRPSALEFISSALLLPFGFRNRSTSNSPIDHGAIHSRTSEGTTRRPHAKSFAGISRRNPVARFGSIGRKRPAGIPRRKSHPLTTSSHAFRTSRTDGFGPSARSLGSREI